MELGKGFTYIGNQYVLEYNGKRSKVDMLFFHRDLHCLVAIDLKIGEFKPEYAGKMNYYLSLLDRLERREGENRSIGIILCAEKDRGDRTGIGRYGQTNWCSRLSVNYTTGRTKESRGRRSGGF